MAFDRKSASAKRDLQRPSPTIVQKREIFERRTRKSKALKVMYFLSRPIGVAFGLFSLFYRLLVDGLWFVSIKSNTIKMRQLPENKRLGTLKSEHLPGKFLWTLFRCSTIVKEFQP